MRILVAEDDRVNRRLLEVSLAEWGHEVVLATNGLEAWEALQRDDAPSLAILDWMMPEMDGVEVCRRVRAAEPRLTYIILLTAKGQLNDVVTGLEAGADDYIVKPFDPQELRTRVQAGFRLLELQQKLVERARDVEAMRVQVAEQARFRQAVSEMSDAILTLDEQWRLTTANHAARLLLDLPEAWTGLALDEVLAPFTVSVPPPVLCAAAERVTAFEVSRPDTHPPLLLDARLSRVRDDGGDLRSAVLIVRDVTDERLPRHVQSNFMTAMPHKLRTPLSLLLGYLGLAKHLSPEELPQQWPRISAVWEGELRYLIALVQKLLDFEQLAAEELASGQLNVAVADVAAEVGAAVRARYPDRDVDFRTDVAPDATRAALRSDHLAFILRELMDNAVRFGDKQPAQVTLTVTTDAPGRLRGSVADNGPGIPHEYYDRVFEDFVQVEEHVTGQIPGWGVGLRMVRQVVEAYGGQISVTSRLGEGSTFTFTVPAATAS